MWKVLQKEKWTKIDFGRSGAYEAVVRMSEETLDHRAALSPGDGSGCGK